MTAALAAVPAALKTRNPDTATVVLLANSLNPLRSEEPITLVNLMAVTDELLKAVPMFLNDDTVLLLNFLISEANRMIDPFNRLIGLSASVTLALMPMSMLLAGMDHSSTTLIKPGWNFDRAWKSSACLAPK